MRSRPQFRGAVSLLLAISLTACATSGPSAVPGQRVLIQGGRELPGGERTQPVLGELVRREADTVWVRTDSDQEARAFLLSASRRLAPRVPTSRTDPWLLGDSLRERRIVAGSQNGWEYWTVAAPIGDVLAVEHARTESSVSGRPLRSEPMVERQVRRVRAGGRVLGGLALIAAGALPLLLIDNDPEPATSIYPDIDGTTLVVGAIAGGVMGAGVGLVLSASKPRTGWDPVPDAELPPLREATSPSVGLEVRIPAR